MELEVYTIGKQDLWIYLGTYFSVKAFAIRYYNRIDNLL
jgi:hypothetical protein